jgi:hypothetical protein
VERPTIRSSHGNQYAVLGEFKNGGILCQGLDVSSLLSGCPSLSVWRLRDSDAPCEILTYEDVDYERVVFTIQGEAHA